MAISETCLGDIFMPFKIRLGIKPFREVSVDKHVTYTQTLKEGRKDRKPDPKPTEINRPSSETLKRRDLAPT